jgi:hypothetical protein
MDSSLFRRLIYLDYWFGGRCFMYWDGASLYHLPEGKMEVVASETAGTGYIDHFLFDGNVTFWPNEIIFVKDNSFNITTIYGGIKYYYIIREGNDAPIFDLIYFRLTFFTSAFIIVISSSHPHAHGIFRHLF